VTTQRSSAATEKGQAVWPGTGARRSATRSAVWLSNRGEPSGVTNVRRSAGAREERKEGAGRVEGRQILEEQSILEVSDHVQICSSRLPCQQRRDPGKDSEVGNGRELAAG
jgi:hypothetical protein